MFMKQSMQFLVFVFLTGFFLACSSSKTDKYQETALDKLVKQKMNEKTFSIVLYDMDFDNDKFKHKYKIITDLTDSVKKKEEITDWLSVSEEFFLKNQDNLGLELAGKGEDGKIHKIPAPPGYSSYVGNEKYGQWKTDNSGNSFWAFYGQYMFMSSMFNMMASPVYRSGYYDYRNNYYGNRPYYGSRDASGNYQYGTYGSTTQKSSPTFFERNQNKSDNFKSRLQSRVGSSSTRSTTSGQASGSSSRTGSSSASGTTTRSSSSSSSSSSSTSRSSSRSSSSSSSTSRSRSGSSGK
jgi:hypothetical protein